MSTTETPRIQLVEVPARLRTEFGITTHYWRLWNLAASGEFPVVRERRQIYLDCPLSDVARIVQATAKPLPKAAA